MQTHKADIMIVDDTPANLRLLMSILTQEGYRVRPMTNGQAALSAIKAARPDLILLDIMMPKMNGYEVCRQLKGDATTKDIPIVFLSALNATDHKVKAFQAGGVDFITKPFQSAEVLARVQTHLTLSQLQQTLAERLAELQARNEELDAFSHTVAHDLKNPVSNIVGFAEVLDQYFDKLSPEEIRDSIHSIAINGRKLDVIIEELMLLAGLRKRTVEATALDMASIVEAVKQRLMDLIQKSEAQITTHDITTWPVASGYAPWVEEVWANYISNAIKYGGKPPLIELGAQEDDDGMVHFWVQDNGEGLDADALDAEGQQHLFKPFTSLSEVHTKGHGLGLSIVRRIVEKLNGEVRAESQAGQGSTFYFSLPAAREQGPGPS